MFSRQWLLTLIFGCDSDNIGPNLWLLEICKVKCGPGFLTKIDFFQHENIFQAPLHNRTFDVYFVTYISLSTAIEDAQSMLIGDSIEDAQSMIIGNSTEDA